MRLGGVLREWRTTRGATLKALAAEIGIPLAVLAKLERGGAVSGRTLGRLLVWLLAEGEK